MEITQKADFKKLEARSREKVPVKVQNRLWVVSGGRCSFRGCNENLYRDDLTLKETNLANVAHIVAAKFGGPRGDDPMPLDKRAELSNLMLMCPKHHKLIDSRENGHLFPKDLLKQMKEEHEGRISFLTGLNPDNKTFLIGCKANILDEIVSLSESDIHDAIFPDYYPMKDHNIELDLVKTPGMDSAEYYASKKQEIDLYLKRYLEPFLMSGDVDHISVFALGPIPLLAHLGFLLPNKVETRFFQRHRCSEKWRWLESGQAVEFVVNMVKEGRPGKQAVLLLSLSGSIPEDTYSSFVAEGRPIYELTFKERAPDPTFLSDEKTISKFKMAYRKFLSSLKTSNPEIEDLAVLPAVPAPIAVLLGRELLKKVDPHLSIYDYNKKYKKFSFALGVN